MRLLTFCLNIHDLYAFISIFIAEILITYLQSNLLSVEKTAQKINRAWKLCRKAAKIVKNEKCS